MWIKKVIIFLSLPFLFFTNAIAHCDTRNGPVVKAAREAIRTNNVKLVLIWVRQKDERVIEEIFRKTMEVRILSPIAQGLADEYFFETLVRIHREGEGEPYTGLKDSAEVSNVIAAVDNSIRSGTSGEIYGVLSSALRKELDIYFSKAISSRDYDPFNVSAGRKHIENYVELLHFVERFSDPKQGLVHPMDESSKEEVVTHPNKNDNMARDLSPIRKGDRTQIIGFIIIFAMIMVILFIRLVIAYNNKNTTSRKSRRHAIPHGHVSMHAPVKTFKTSLKHA